MIFIDCIYTYMFVLKLPAGILLTFFGLQKLQAGISVLFFSWHLLLFVSLQKSQAGTFVLFGSLKKLQAGRLVLYMQLADGKSDRLLTDSRKIAYQIFFHKDVWKWNLHVPKCMQKKILVPILYFRKLWSGEPFM